MTARKTVTVQEACELTGKSERTIQHYCLTRVFEAYKAGNAWVIYKSSVNDYIRAENTRVKANKFAYRRGERKW